MNRPDKLRGALSKTEIELGGIPNTSEDIRQAHAAAIESYIEENVGSFENRQGNRREGKRNGGKETNRKTSRETDSIYLFLVSELPIDRPSPTSMLTRTGTGIGIGIGLGTGIGIEIEILARGVLGRGVAVF